MIAYAREVLYSGRAGRVSEEKAGASGGYVWDTYSAAIWCLEHTDNYRDCVLTAVNLGDDTDTTACVAGGLAGILYGYEGIPAEWIEALRGKDVIDASLFGGVYGDDLRRFVKRFEDSLDGPTRDFYGLAHDMFALGWHMDCGEAFAEAYPCSGTAEGLRGDIDSIGDVGLLGSGVFSRWRYVTHWKYDGTPDEDDLEWFRLALGRLRELA